MGSETLIFTLHSSALFFFKITSIYCFYHKIIMVKKKWKKVRLKKVPKPIAPKQFSTESRRAEGRRSDKVRPEVTLHDGTAPTTACRALL